MAEHNRGTDQRGEPRARRTEAPESPGGPRSIYHKPELQSLGTLRELIRGSSGPALDVGGQSVGAQP